MLQKIHSTREKKQDDPVLLLILLIVTNKKYLNYTEKPKIR